MPGRRSRHAKGPATRRMTAKEAAFVREYPVDNNGAQAAIRAGYSEATARQAATRLLSKVYIQTAIEAERTKIAEKVGLTKERVLEEFRRIALFDPRKAMDWKSNILAEVKDPDTGEAAGVHLASVTLKDSNEISDEAASAIASIKQTAKGDLEVRFHDKVAALNSAARHLGMFIDRSEVSGKDGAPIETAVSEVDREKLARRVAFLLRRAQRGRTPRDRR